MMLLMLMLLLVLVAAVLSINLLLAAFIPSNRSIINSSTARDEGSGSGSPPSPPDYWSEDYKNLKEAVKIEWHKNLRKQLLTMPEYSTEFKPEFAPHIIRGSRGVVLTGPSSNVGLAIMAVDLLRKTGCKLDVEYAYIPGEITDDDLKRLKSFNIQTREFLPPEEMKNIQWGSSEFKLGAPKVDSILSSSFEEVLFLDPDVMVVRDPTFLFDSLAYNATGAIFFPDFPSTSRDKKIWDIMDLSHRPNAGEREFESGQIFLNKTRVWAGLKMAQVFLLFCIYLLN